MAAFLKAQTDAFYVVVDALVASNTIRSLTFAFSARLATIFDQRSYVPIRGSLPQHAPRDHMELDHIRFISEGECSRRSNRLSRQPKGGPWDFRLRKLPRSPNKSQLTLTRSR
jgi:hypothetical protein